MAAEGEGGKMRRQGERNQEAQTCSYKVSHGNVAYSTGNTVSSIVINMYGDGVIRLTVITS